MDVAPRIQNSRLGIFLLCAGVAFSGSAKRKTPRGIRYPVVGTRVSRWCSWRSSISQMKTSRPFLHIARSITLMIGTVSFFTALIYLSLPEAVAINFVAPLLVTALSIPFLGEKVGPRRWAAIFVGFLGVLVIIRPGLGVMHWAAFLPLITAISYAGYQIMTRIAGREDTKTTSFWTSVGVIVMSCIVPFAGKRRTRRPG